MCINSSLAFLINVFCKNISPQLTPVRHSSGNTKSLTPSFEALSICFNISSPLYTVSATLSLGLTAATLRKESLILHSFLRLF